jgi:hypothetical protein
MRASLASLFALAFTFFGVALGQQENSSWQEYTYAADGFAIKAPAAPKPQPSPALPGATAYPMQLKDDKAFVVVRVKPTPDCSTFLARYRETLVSGKDSDVDLSSLRDVTLSDHSGLEYKRKVHVNTVMERWYCTDSHLYALSVVRSSSASMPATATRIVESFRLLTKTERH